LGKGNAKILFGLKKKRIGGGSTFVQNGSGGGWGDKGGGTKERRKGSGGGDQAMRESGFLLTAMSFRGKRPGEKGKGKRLLSGPLKKGKGNEHWGGGGGGRRNDDSSPQFKKKTTARICLGLYYRIPPKSKRGKKAGEKPGGLSCFGTRG